MPHARSLRQCLDLWVEKWGQGPMSAHIWQALWGALTLVGGLGRTSAAPFPHSRPDEVTALEAG